MFLVPESVTTSPAALSAVEATGLVQGKSSVYPPFERPSISGAMVRFSRGGGSPVRWFLLVARGGRAAFLSIPHTELMGGDGGR